ncbi:MAG: hypothetical protein DHS20C15_01860 [Planctomycetota bacterium]|nr:MAG: hypothetical protein DHS20C15_01860 [Planctomycetota bacterium]
MPQPLTSSSFTPRSTILSVALFSLLAGCGGGGGGGGGTQNSNNTAQIKTTATTATDGTARRVDLVGGPIETSDPAFEAVNVALTTFLSRLMSTKGVDLDRDLVDTNADGVPDTGFDTYSTGMAPKQGAAARIFGANNLYDLFQTSTNQTPSQRPLLVQPLALGGSPAGPPFNGGDASGDGLTEGGPGLFSNINTATAAGSPTSPMPSMPTLPNAMGDRDPITGSARGPSPTDQHQFIQIEFPYAVKIDSLRDPFAPGNSFLGDSLPGTPNVLVERRWVTRTPEGDNNQFSIIDHTFEHAHVPGIAILGGEAFVPGVGGSTTSISVALSNLPEAAKAKVMDPRVLTYIAHENPAGISTVAGSPLGFVNPEGVLILPDPTDPAGLGGRVFGGSLAVPSSVNDFMSDGGAGTTSDANRIGFFSFHITRLRSGGKTINSPYFHSFPVSQAFVGDDAASVGAIPGTFNGTFNRGPAIEVDSVTQIPAIDVADPNSHYLGSFTLTPGSDDENIISTKARFRVNFDKEMVPNSVGFSRRHTIHSVPGEGVVFPFNGNTRPITSPAADFVSAVQGAPLAPSIFLAVNQPVQVGVNNPQAKNVNPDATLTDAQASGAGVFVGGPTVNGLFPTQHNTLATLPRGVVPCDIYPLNQNNLQAYIIEPLVELPPFSVVTVGVAMPGLGTSNNTLPTTVPTIPTNYGNFTRSGTVTTPWQGLTALGLGNPDVSQNVVQIGNATVVKVNAGPMDLEGKLFFGGTGTAIDTLINGVEADDMSDGGWNVCRSFRVGSDLTDAYVNAPVAPQAVVVGFGPKGLGVVDLSGSGLTTNVPGGSALNTGSENTLVTSRFLPPPVSGQAGLGNWSAIGSIAAGSHSRAFGTIGRYTAGNCLNCMPASIESEFAVGAAIQMGTVTEPGVGAVPGVNEGSSGFETMVRDSSGSIFLTDPELALVNDVVVGDFLDTLYFDDSNVFAVPQSRRTYNTPTATAVPNNTIADPPVPNPPPMRFPVGLPHTGVIFDQSDLSRDPVLIEGSEVFPRDAVMQFDDGSGQGPIYPINGFIHLSPTSNEDNENTFDVPYLPSAGFSSPFIGDPGSNPPAKFLHMGPVPRTNTAGAVLLVGINAAAPGAAEPGGLQIPFFQARQQIGNFLFVTDGINKKLHAVNSNNMEVLASLTLPDPTGLGMTSDLRLLYVSNQGANSVSVVDSDPDSPNFMTVLNTIAVGEGPRGVAVAPDNEDVFVLNRLGNSVSIIDVGSSAVRRTLEQSGINRPNDVALGMRETGGGPAFQSGTYHGFISNGGNDSVVVFESGPSGVAGIGFDNILGAIAQGDDDGQVSFIDMDDPRGMAFDPSAPLDPFSRTIGAYVAHRSAETGQAMISRIAYSKDSSPGQSTFNINALAPNFGDKVFEIKQQYQSTASGIAYDVAISDHNRRRVEDSNYGSNNNLFNAGAIEIDIGGVTLPRNSKYPLASWNNPLTTLGARWDPDRVYLSVSGGIIEVFDISQGTHQRTILTPGGEPTKLATFFGQ